MPYTDLPMNNNDTTIAPLSDHALSPQSHSNNLTVSNRSVTPVAGDDTVTTPIAKSVRTPSSKSKSVSKPAYLEMVVSAIRGLKERNGSSIQAIRKSLAQNYFNGDANSINKATLSKTLKAAVSQEKLLRLPGHNAYKLNIEYLKEVKAKQALVKRKKIKQAKAATPRVISKVKVEKKAKPAMTASTIKKRLDRERREQMLKEREKKLLKNKMEDIALIKQDKEMGIKMQVPKHPCFEPYLKLFPFTLMDTTSSLTKLSNRAKQARLYAFECVNVSARCWDILYGSGNLNMLLGKQETTDRTLSKHDDDSDSDTVSTGDSSTELPLLTFENFVHTFAQCTANDVIDPPLTVWVLLDWCLEHLLDKDDDLAHIPRSSSTIVHIAKLFAMNRLHQVKAAFHHDNEYAEIDDNSQAMDDESQSQTADDGDESMDLQMSIDEDMEDASATELSAIMEDMFPSNSDPKYHNILLFLCEELLLLPQVADDLAKRDSSRNEFMRRLRSADTTLRKLKTQWKAQLDDESGEKDKSVAQSGSNTTRKTKLVGLKDDKGIISENKENKPVNNEASKKPVSKKEYETAQAMYEDLVRSRFDSKYHCRMIVLGEDRYFKTYYLLPGQGILILCGDRNPDAPKYDASMLKDPKDLETLKGCLDQRGQRESELLQNLSIYGGVSNWLPKQGGWGSPIVLRIAELHSNLKTTSSSRVQGCILAEIRQLEKQLIPTSEDLSGESSLTNSVKKSMGAGDVFTSSCKLLTRLSKRVSDITGDEQISTEVGTLVKSAKDSVSMNMKKGWSTVVETMQYLQSVLYKSSLLQLSCEHSKHKPSVEKYASSLSEVVHLSSGSVALIRELMIDAISDLKQCVVSSDIDIESSNDETNDLNKDVTKLKQLLAGCRAALKLWREKSANSTQSAVRNIIEKFDILDVTSDFGSNKVVAGVHQRQKDVVLDSHVLFDAFEKPGVWLSYLTEKSEITSSSFCHQVMLSTAVHAFGSLANGLIDEMQEGQAALKKVISQYRRRASKRTTRGSKESTDSGDLPALVTECNSDETLWCQCEKMDKFVLSKGVMPEPSLYWPVRIMDVSDGKLARDLVLLGLRAVVVVHCGVKNLAVQIVPDDLCRPMSYTSEYETEMCSNESVIDMRTLKLWKASIEMVSKSENI